MKSIFDKALELLRDGAKRVDFEEDGLQITAYWAGTVLRIDIKGLRR